MARTIAFRFLFLAGAVGLLTAATAEAAGPFQFFSVTPCRIVDTRGPTGVTGGPALASGSTRNFPISLAPAACGVPNTAKAAVLNVTLVSPSLDGFLSIWPFGTTPPLVSTINAAAGEPAIANAGVDFFLGFGTLRTTLPKTAAAILLRRVGVLSGRSV